MLHLGVGCSFHTLKLIVYYSNRFEEYGSREMGTEVTHAVSTNGAWDFCSQLAARGTASVALLLEPGLPAQPLELRVSG